MGWLEPRAGQVGTELEEPVSTSYGDIPEHMFTPRGSRVGDFFLKNFSLLFLFILGSCGG